MASEIPFVVLIVVLCFCVSSGVEWLIKKVRRWSD